MPARSAADRRALASIAALTRSTRESGAERMRPAHEAYQATFRRRHECALCGLVEIDQALPADEIERRGAAAYRAHMRRLAYWRARAARAVEVIDSAAGPVTGLAPAS